MNIKCHATREYFIKLYINDSLHLAFAVDKFIGMQAWNESHVQYYIKIYLTDKEILCEYDHIDKWKSVLKLLDDVIY